MVGCGFLKPAIDKLRTDTPKALRRLLDNCLSHTRDIRPAFRNVMTWSYRRDFEIKIFFTQVLVSLENLMSSLPKIHRSLSEPILNRSVRSLNRTWCFFIHDNIFFRTNIQSEELFSANCSSPKTPVNANLSSFTFASHVWTRVYSYIPCCSSYYRIKKI